MSEALDPLLAEAELQGDDNSGRRLGAAVALVSLHVTPEQRGRIREVLKRVYGQAEKVTRMQLLVAMQHMVDPGLLDFMLAQARQPEDELPDIRVIALKSYSLLANKSEAAAARALIDREPGPEDGGFKQNFQENMPALAAANECDQDVACWIRKLDDRNTMVARKAAYMLARYGRGNAQAITALVGKIGHSNEEVRGDVLYAIDILADRGSPEAVAKIDQLRAQEGGRAIWQHVEQLALTTQSRLRNRAGR